MAHTMLWKIYPMGYFDRLDGSSVTTSLKSKGLDKAKRIRKGIGWSLLQFKNYINLVISEKKRGYFHLFSNFWKKYDPIFFVLLESFEKINI